MQQAFRKQQLDRFEVAELDTQLEQLATILEKESALLKLLIARHSTILTGSATAGRLYRRITSAFV